jgi:hypothetical protein
MHTHLHSCTPTCNHAHPLALMHTHFELMDMETSMTLIALDLAEHERYMHRRHELHELHAF